MDDPPIARVDLRLGLSSAEERTICDAVVAPQDARPQLLPISEHATAGVRNQVSPTSGVRVEPVSQDIGPSSSASVRSPERRRIDKTERCSLPADDIAVVDGPADERTGAGAEDCAERFRSTRRDDVSEHAAADTADDQPRSAVIAPAVIAVV